ncbi:MAG TPA: hypothetical protein DE315_06030 [Candidatus Omnitrophica bacterium]|nr:MAG: hypothetical protein A2Y05_02185 [Omnitrophica WOR_2 bacterium GWA2_53_43]HBO96984.1 hypothetical protein [Candidatus Omnitrophota bacterium]HCI45068.1 hypothetical protein [Candidatus Omnitrophota bacterium]
MERTQAGILVMFVLSAVCLSVPRAHGQDDLSEQSIFDDQQLLDGYAQKYADLSKDVILEMIMDDTLNPYQIAAAVRVFKERYSGEVVSREKSRGERILVRRLKLTDSPFVEVEIMHTLCRMDRYRYFQPMVPALIQKLNHYNAAVNEIAFNSLNDIIGAGNKRAREARVVFTTIRKMLFLSRNRLVNVTDPDEKLARKLKLLRWSIKVLGRQELNRLPPEVINLL